MKKKNIEQYVRKPMNVIIYDDENIRYYHSIVTSFSSEPEFMGDDYIASWSIFLDVPNIEMLDNISLDETTMKRIAKYNKQQECKRLDKEIEEKTQKIKDLDILLKDKEKRWNKVKEYIANIYDLDLDESDDYDWDE